MTALLGGDETMMSEHTPQQAPPAPSTGVPAEDVAAVHAYAGAFCGSPATAADLAGAVLAGREGPVARTALLADVRRTAFGWLRDERAGLLLPGFRDWARWAGETFGATDTLRRVEHDALLLRAFGDLADQSRAALWLCLAEDEPALAARVLHTSEEFAAAMAESARARLADTFLRLRAEHTADARCVHYGGMLGAIARGTHREMPADLEQHLETCEFCAHDIALLRTLTSGGPRELRPLLVDRLLLWGGPAYRSARSAPAEGAGPAPAERASRARSGSWAQVASRVGAGLGTRTRARPRTAGAPGAEPPAAPPASAGPAVPAGAAGTRTGRGGGPGPRGADHPAPARAAASAARPARSTPAHQSAPEIPGAPASPAFPDPPAPASAPAAAAPRRPVFALAAAVVVTAVATGVTLSLLSDTGSGAAVNSYGPPPAAPSQAPSASPGTGTVLATVRLESVAAAGSCVAGASPDVTPAPAPCDGGAAQQWRVVDIEGGAVALRHVASGACLDIAGYRAVGDPMQLRPCAYRQGARAPFPEDQAFVLGTRPDKTFTLVCQDNPAIAVGVADGEVRMLPSATAGRAIRFAPDDALAKALGG
ncbi:RICIN domain-containing protein [Streptomyces sp. WSLK1-5]